MPTLSKLILALTLVLGIGCGGDETSAEYADGGLAGGGGGGGGGSGGGAGGSGGRGRSNGGGPCTATVAGGYSATYECFAIVSGSSAMNLHIGNVREGDTEVFSFNVPGFQEPFAGTYTETEGVVSAGGQLQNPEGQAWTLQLLDPSRPTGNLQNKGTFTLIITEAEPGIGLPGGGSGWYLRNGSLSARYEAGVMATEPVNVHVDF